MGGRAAAAAIYSVELCEAMCRGLRRQLEYDKTGKVASRPLSGGEVKQLLRNLASEEVACRSNCTGSSKVSRIMRMECRRRLVGSAITGCARLCSEDSPVKDINSMAGWKDISALAREFVNDLDNKNGQTGIPEATTKQN